MFVWSQSSVAMGVAETINTRIIKNIFSWQGFKQIYQVKQRLPIIFKLCDGFTNVFACVREANAKLEIQNNPVLLQQSHNQFQPVNLPYNVICSSLP